MADHDKSLVYIVDDEETVRDSLSQLLRSLQIESNSFTSAEDFLDHLPEDRPACVILDLHMPDMSGLELQELMKSRGMELPLIFLSGQGDIASGVKAMKTGAQDFLEKPVEDEALIRSIDQALNYARDQRRARQRVKILHDRYQTLTEREQQVMAYVGKGLLNKQIADQLDISERTVKAHRKQVMEKMQANSVADLTLQLQHLTRPRRKSD